uniref:Uncharacterized protein n=1 Tax=Quercus lobata TaxID=97700 RepID=A0A7N2LSE6_QUELO
MTNSAVLVSFEFSTVLTANHAWPRYTVQHYTHQFPEGTSNLNSCVVILAQFHGSDSFGLELALQDASWNFLNIIISFNFLETWHRIGCEGEDWAHSKRSSSKAEAVNEAKSKKKSKRSSPPIPVSYFPVGTQFSRL